MMQERSPSAFRPVKGAIAVRRLPTNSVECLSLRELSAETPKREGGADLTMAELHQPPRLNPLPHTALYRCGCVSADLLEQI